MLTNLITYMEYQELVKDNFNKLVVVFFSKRSDLHCFNLEKEVTSLQAEFSDVVFAKVDVEINQETAIRCHVKTTPAFQFTKEATKLTELDNPFPDVLRDEVINYK